MTAIKAADVDRFIARPDSNQPIVLVFGPDAGLVRERVDALVRASVDDPADPFTFVRIDGDELATNPSRLVEEAHTVPLFGGRRAVLVKAGSRNIAQAVDTVIAAPSTAGGPTPMSADVIAWLSAMITARLITFSSSRTLPGQG